MNLVSTADSVTELLERIIDFAEQRRQTLTANIANVNTPGYVPHDLDVEGFADRMTRAVAEYMQSERLVLCDHDNVKFGPRGRLEAAPTPDHEAWRLLESDTRGYLEQQVGKLAENLINHKVATELLKARQRTCLHQRSDDRAG